MASLGALGERGDPGGHPVLCSQDARTAYRRILSESARKLNAQGSQLGNCIEKARPYYEARRLAKEVTEHPKGAE